MSAMSELLEKASIKDIAEASIKLTKRGDTYWGLSPFKTEKTPSMKLDVSQNTFYCFATKQGGGVVDLFAVLNNLTRHEAFMTLCEMYEIEVEDKGQDDSIVKCVKCLKSAHAFFMQYTEEPIAYISKPTINLGPEVVEKYQLGYAPKDRSLLIEHLRFNGFEDEIIIESGAGILDKEDKLVAFHADRIIFPIKDAHGRLVAFSGRRLVDVDEDGKKIDYPPKYLHGKSTKLFKKDNVLWGIEHARKMVKEKGRILVMEGFMDVIPSLEAGEPTVGTLGAIPTHNQFNMLIKYASDIYMCSDNDEAGQKALYESFFTLEKLGLNLITYMFTLPAGKDPGEFIAEYGPEEFTRLVNNAVSDTANIVRYTINKHAEMSTTDAALKRRVIADLQSHFKELSTFSYRTEDLVERIAQHFGMDYKSVRSWLRTNPSLNHNSSVYNKIDNLTYDAPIYEIRLLVAAIKNPLVVYKIKDAGLSLSDFEDGTISRTLGKLFSKPITEHTFNYLQLYLTVEDYNKVFELYHNSSDSMGLDVDTIINAMYSAILRKRKHSSKERRTNFLGKPLNSAEREKKAIMSDILADDNEASKEQGQS